METLHLQAQGTHHSGTDMLMIIVTVKEADGTPVEGLSVRNFKVRLMGTGFGSVSPTVFQDFDAFSDLDGVYRLVFHHWAPAVDGTFCHHIRVTAGGLRRRGDTGEREEEPRVGSCLSFVVKVGGGPE